MAKCKICKGTGNIIFNNITLNKIYNKECVACEGTGVMLRTVIEEQYDEAAELDGTKLHKDEATFIEFEEDDYEV